MLLIFMLIMKFDGASPKASKFMNILLCKTTKVKVSLHLDAKKFKTNVF
jgi:hypothetical protein